MRRLSLCLAFLMVLALPAQAEPYTYAPDDCEFQMAFPGEPYTTRRCHPDFPDRCDLITGYTKVYELSHTMNFYVSCKPIKAGAFENYNKDALSTTLIAMAGRNRLENYETAYDDGPGDVKRGSLMGAGPSLNGQNMLLYMGQIWVGQSSLLTVEGELIGAAGEDTDRIFAEVLRSVTTKKWAEDAAKAAEEAEKPEESSKSP